MLPAELADEIVKLGICYQLHVEEKGLNELLTVIGAVPPKEEDFSDVGYNKDEEKQKIQPAAGVVITDPAELLKYDGWHLSLKPPKEFPKMFVGPHYFGYIQKRRFTVRGDDFPWTTGAIKHSFALEYVKGVKIVNNIFLVLTSFGQTGIVIN